MQLFRAGCHGDLSPELSTRSGIYQSCFPSLFIFNLVIEMIVEIALSLCEDGDIDICSDKNLSDLQNKDDVVLLNEDPSKLKVLSIVCKTAWGRLACAWYH